MIGCLNKSKMYQPFNYMSSYTTSKIDILFNDSYYVHYLLIRWLATTSRRRDFPCFTVKQSTFQRQDSHSSARQLLLNTVRPLPRERQQCVPSSLTTHLDAQGLFGISDFDEIPFIVLSLILLAALSLEISSAIVDLPHILDLFLGLMTDP